MRICSFVPSGTEILYALGLGEAVVGVSHECDYPPDALKKPRLIRAVIDRERPSREIDQAVRRSLEGAESLYRIDGAALAAAAPDLVITQALCEVCAAGPGQLDEALNQLPIRPQVITLHPHALEKVLEEIQLLGEWTGRRQQARALITGWRDRLERLQKLLEGIGYRPRVFCLEWLEPPMAAGHWVPEMVEYAGGREILGRAGAASRYVTEEEIEAAAPEILIVMPCGFSVERTRRELPLLAGRPWWSRVPAVRDGRVYLVDAPAYFNRSGPRLIDGIELLAGLLHPDRCASLIPHGAAVGVTTAAGL